MGPQKDYTKQEAKMVKEYLEQGGKVIASFECANSLKVKKPNFNSIFEAYNVKIQNGIVAENDEQCYMPQQLDGTGGPLFAMAKGTEGFAADISGQVMSPYSIGLNKKDKNNEEITYTSLAKTSNSAVLKTNPNKAKKYTKEKGDIDGPYDLMVSLEKNVAATKSSSVGTDKVDSKQAEILLFSSVYSLSDSVDSLVSNSNTEIVSNALDKYIDTDVETVTVAKKSLQVKQLTVSAKAVRLCIRLWNCYLDCKEKEIMKKSQIITLVVLLVVLGLCVGGYFVGKQYFADKEKKEEAAKKTSVLKIDTSKVIGVAYSYKGKTYTIQKDGLVWKNADDKKMKLKQSDINQKIFRSMVLQKIKKE